MRPFLSIPFLTSPLFLVTASPVSRDGKDSSFNLKPFTVDLSDGVPHMIDLAERTRLPTEGDYFDPNAGISLETLQSLRKELIENFDWNAEQQELNKLHHFTAEIENQTIHFIHQQSDNPEAIPLVLNHGWPGSFLEFIPLIEKLRDDFHIIIPSLPGFAFSSAPPPTWTVDDTARLFNTLMTKVLGYPKYAAYGTDWGSGVAYSLYANFNTSVRLVHLSFLPFVPLYRTQLAAEGIKLSPLEEFEAQVAEEWATTGNAYYMEQATKPNTIGLALYDNPVGQLSWIAEKLIVWSDPRTGTPPSVLDHNEMLKTVALYYLTKSFASSVYIYYSNPNGFMTNYTKAETDAPLLFSAFKYNPGFWPPELVGRVGNLVSYKNHEFGGHFSGLDNPVALAEDLKDIKKYWGR
ncbi:related to epoxide hydrolase [Fusarium fujikuroi IMI 58289]|uniref:Related to epoxide hydrolase n=1 Tax=Gibberella fujikuroi (strain CBS 195.34 / IMI 58289 / NRRL A-6831) TaxID=1279085 RepID=S0EJ85_GIBF5|nr:related to epoxide hydrolase [Fusarium fujikuroi IMI 58289]CCT73932.1 related to epoxide hydrolase [Fusarium fujikuroi IMI 58289]SCO09367.1 related to epoxide hydrolase [Fusarium fujikuroi]